MFNNLPYFQKQYEESKTKRSREVTNEKTNKLNRHFNLFCKNINPSLKRELGLPETELDDECDWTPPSTHGLGNSERIIPEEYLDINRPLSNLNFFETIKIDVRNIKPLSKFQLNYISTHLSKENIIELIQIYNDCFCYIENVMKDL
jgi:hypothetical protein